MVVLERLPRANCILVRNFGAEHLWTAQHFDALARFAPTHADVFSQAVRQAPEKSGVARIDGRADLNAEGRDVPRRLVRPRAPGKIVEHQRELAGARLPIRLDDDGVALVVLADA